MLWSKRENKRKCNTNRSLWFFFSFCMLKLNRSLQSFWPSVFSRDTLSPIFKYCNEMKTMGACINDHSCQGKHLKSFGNTEGSRICRGHHLPAMRTGFSPWLQSAHYLAQTLASFSEVFAGLQIITVQRLWGLKFLHRQHFDCRLLWLYFAWTAPK